MSTFSQHFHSSSHNRGFTLIEMMVVAAIITILTAVFLFQQARFDSATILRGLAYSAALSVRQAQVYGTSVLGVGSGSSAFAPAYGIYVSTGASHSYVLFADQAPSNGKYDSGEEVKVFTIDSKYTISRFCAYSTAWRCQSDNGADSLQILFKRPNPDAAFVLLKPDGTAAFPSDSYSRAYIQLQSGEGTYRDVLVNVTGQVSVLAPNTDPS